MTVTMTMVCGQTVENEMTICGERIESEVMETSCGVVYVSSEA